MQEAVKLGAIQAQAVHSNFSPTTGPGFLKLQDFVPKQWLAHKRIKPKQIEAMIYNEWRTLVNTDTTNAKYKYVQAVRQLPTYGITFYCVKVPNPKKSAQKKNPFVPLLVGVTSTKILKLDFETKQVMKEYPLEHLKRWAAVRGKFTFDFGDHEESYWTVFTDEGEAMSDLISGYIDLILANRRGAMQTLDDDNGGEAGLEEELQADDAHYTAMVGANMPSAAGFMVRGGSLVHGSGPAGTGGLVPGLGGALVQLQTIKQELSQPSSAANNRRTTQNGSPADWMDNLVQFERSMDQNVAVMVDTLQDPNADKDSLNRLAEELVRDMTGFRNAAETVAAMNGQPQIKETALDVLSSLIDLIGKGDKHVAHPDPTMLDDSNRSFQNAMLLMQGVQNNHITDDATIELVEGALKAIQAAVDELVEVSDKHVQNVSQPEKQRLINNYSKQLVGGQAHLESTARTLAPALVDENCRRHVIDKIDVVRGLSEGLVRSSLDGFESDPEAKAAFFNASNNVYRSIDTLLAALTVSEEKGAGGGPDLMRSYQLLADSVPLLQSKTTNQKQLLDGVKAIAMNGNDILRGVIEMSADQPPEAKKELNYLVALNKQNLASFTPKGKDAVRQPNDMAARETLAASAEEVKASMDALMKVAQVANIDSMLRAAAKVGLGKQLALSAAIKQAAKDQVAYSKIVEESRPLSNALVELLGALQQASSHPQQKAYQDALLEHMKAIVPLMGKQVASSTRAPTQGLGVEQSKKLLATRKDAQEGINEIMAAIQAYENVDSSSTNISEALKNMDANKSQIEATIFSAQSGFLAALEGGDSIEQALNVLLGVGEQLTASVNNLEKASVNSGDISHLATDTSLVAADMVAACEGIAGILPVKEDQVRLLDTLKNLNSDLTDFITTCKDVRLGNKDHDAAAQARRDVAKDLAQLLNNARGLDTSVADGIVNALRAEKNNLEGVRKDGLEFTQALKVADLRAKATVAAVQQLVNAVQTAPGNAINASKIVLSTAKQMVVATNAAAGAAPDDPTYDRLLGGTSQLIDDVADVVEAVHTALATGNWYPVTDAMNNLGVSAADLQRSTSGSVCPEIDEAIRRIQQTLPLLEDYSIPGKSSRAVLHVSDKGCAALPPLSESLTSAAAVGPDCVGVYATEIANEVCALIDVAATAGQEIDPENSTSAKIGPSTRDYLVACRNIITHANQPQVVGDAAIVLARVTKEFAAGAREIAVELDFSKDRQKKFIESSKALSTGLPKLVAAIKANKPSVITKCTEFLQVACKKMEAAILGVDPDEFDIDPDTPVEPDVAGRLKQANAYVGDAGIKLLRACGDLATNPSNSLFSSNVLGAHQEFDAAVAALVQILSELNPAKQAMIQTQETLKQAITKLEISAINTEVGVLERVEKTKPQLQQELADLLQSLSPDVRLLASATDGQQLLEAVEHISFSIPGIVGAAQGLSSYSNSSRLLGQAKALSQSIQKLIGECHKGGSATGKLSDDVNDQIGELLGCLKASNQIFSEIDMICELVNALPNQLGVAVAPSSRPYPEIKDLIGGKTKAMMVAATGLKTCDLSSPGAVGLQTRNLAQTLPEILTLSRDAIVTLQDPAIKEKLKSHTESMVYSVTEMIGAAKEVLKEDDLTNRAEFNEKWVDFTTSVNKFLTTVKKGSSAENKIDAGTQTVASVIGKLGTASIFASAGQEFDEVPQTNESRDQVVARLINGCAKLPPSVSVLANSGSKSQEELGSEVQKLADLVSNVCEAAMVLASKESDSETQQNLLNSAKAMALSAQQTILSAKNVQASPTDNVAAQNLNNSLNRFPRSVDTFVTVVKGGDAAAAASGLGHLDKIRDAIRALKNNNQANDNVTALSIVESARAVSVSATPLVFGGGQSVLIKGAQASLQAISEFISNLHGARVPVPLKNDLVNSGMAVIDAMCELVDSAKGNRLDPATHDKIAEASHHLNKTLEDVVALVNKMPDGKGLFLHAKGFGAENVTHDALNEAAEMIKQALESLPARSINSETTGKDLKILSEDQLHDCLVHHARTIAEATYALVEGASEAEKESAKDPSKQKYREDQTWANGLSSASQHAAGCVTLLVKSANLAVKGKLDEELLVAHAKQVAASVKQLVIASSVRAVTPTLQYEISNSAKHVVKGTTDIVGVAQIAGEKQVKRNRRQSQAIGNFTAAGGMIQKLEQQAQILRLEKQLEEARQQMGRMNQSDYK
eukprot:TRINITY_DN14106_c0_g1_i1.p1 TRINITY_DN14106_c0_g1~~TRINITY_DN14106_c0_g1_i1.p1  ORF type:complete len:2416 (-),score=736.25 TRINITY_DN14106_c0_g1_i1:53-6697(-)